jgi:hypothetical protein
MQVEKDLIACGDSEVGKYRMIPHEMMPYRIHDLPKSLRREVSSQK